MIVCLDSHCFDKIRVTPIPPESAQYRPVGKTHQIAKFREFIESWSVEATGLRRWLGWRVGIIRSSGRNRQLRFVTSERTGNRHFS